MCGNPLDGQLLSLMILFGIGFALPKKRNKKGAPEQPRTETPYPVISRVCRDSCRRYAPRPCLGFILLKTHRRPVPPWRMLTLQLAFLGNLSY